jgi:tetratricopeptide (TPR) repeat protein
VVLGCALAIRRLGWLGGTLFGLLTTITALTSLFIAQDISRTLMTLCPVLLLGIFLWEWQRPARLRLLLPCVVVANMLLPAAHVMWDQQIPIDWLPVEIARYRNPPSVFVAARLIAEAEQLINAGDSQAGEAKLNQAIELDRRYAIAFVKRASLRMARDETAAAESDLEEALKIKADAPTPLLLRGVIRADRGETAAAKNDFQQALLHAPPGWPGRRAAQDFLDRLNAQTPAQP